MADDLCDTLGKISHDIQSFSRLSRRLTIAFDFGGVLDAAPDLWRDVISALKAGGCRVVVLTDMEREKAEEALKTLEYDFAPDDVICADWSRFRDSCKAVAAQQQGVDLLFDNFPGYCQQASAVCQSVLVWPSLDEVDCG